MAGRVAAWVAGQVAGRDRGARTSTRSRRPPGPACSTRIGHLDFVKRYLAPARHGRRPRGRPGAVSSRSCGRSSRAAPPSRSTRAACARRPGETYPSPAIVARYRELGGERVTVGSDAHLPQHFAWALADGYAAAESVGLEAVAGARDRGPRLARARGYERGPHRHRRRAGLHRPPRRRPAPPTSSATAATASLLDLGQARSPGWPAGSTRPTSTRSSSATSIPTTSSISSRSATTCAGSRRAAAGSGSSGPPGLAERIDALHAEPGFTAAALDVEALATGRG